MSYSRGEKIEWRHWIPIVGTKQKKKNNKSCADTREEKESN